MTPGSPTSALQFEAAFKNHWLFKANNMTDLPTYQLVSAYAQGYAIFQTLVKSNSLDKEDWNRQLFKTQFNSFWGPVALDNVGVNYAKEWITVQVDTNSSCLPF